MKTEYIILGALTLMTASACVKEDSSSDAEFQRKYLQLWIDTYHNGVVQNNDGLYILEDKEGDGITINLAGTEDVSDYVYADVTIRGLDGSISSTTDEKLAKQLGNYDKKKAVYYGPRFYKLGKGNSYAGVDALYSGMKLEGTRTAVIPSWMITTSRYGTQKEYLSNMPSSATHLIYTVTPHGHIDDPLMVELDSIANYVKRNYPQAKPVTYKTDSAVDNTFYFYSDLDEVPVDEDDMPAERDSVAKCTVNYTGRLLNGQVFDTTVEKVAKDAGIYDSGKSYSPVSITYSPKWDSISMGNSSSLINGFKGALFLMKYQGQKAVAIFDSTHGYGEAGDTRSNKIPGYSPLVFEFELVTVVNDM